jgi:hypothetical protein
VTEHDSKRSRGRPAGSYSRNDETAIIRMAAARLHFPERSFKATCEAVFSSDPGRTGTMNAFVSRMHYRRSDIDAAMRRIDIGRRATIPVPDRAGILSSVSFLLGKAS